MSYTLQEARSFEASPYSPKAAPAKPSGAAAPRIAVLIPCYNEAVAIPRVVAAFRAALPEATIYVYDNNSADGTREAARAAGAVVRTETLQGKGHVVRRMFADIEADAYLLVDGDDTYDADSGPEMVRQLLEERLDMVTGVRVTDATAAYRPGHRFGNAMLTGMVRQIFGNRITDMLSGYRAFSRRFVKSFPALAEGFETETEFTVHALELMLPVGEVETAYKERPQGSTSKLRTYSDGFRILRTIVLLVQRERPLIFFGVAGLVLLLAGLGLSVPVLAEYLRTGLVPRLPTAVLSTGLVLLSFLAFVCGLILDTVTRGRKEAKRIAYLSVPGPAFDGGALESQAFRMSLPAYPPPKLLAGAPEPAGAAAGYDADVIILAMDRARETVEAIASARAQEGVSKHVWVADQGSDPENLAILKAALRGAADATLVRLDRNWGVAGGRNRATALGSGRVVFALDNDAEFDGKDALARSVRALDAEPDLAAIACRILVHATGAEDLSSWGYPPSLLAKAAESFDATTFVGAGHAIRRADFAAAGGYDDSLFFCWEEYDFSLRAINMGKRIRYRGDIAVRHKVSGQHRFSWSGTRWFHFVRNRLYIEMKYGAPSPALLPRFLAYQLKGARNGVLPQGLRAGPAALRLAKAFRPPAGQEGLYRLTAAARDYLARNDTAHRGGLWNRARREVLAALPAAEAKPAAR